MYILRFLADLFPGLFGLLLEHVLLSLWTI